MQQPRLVGTLRGLLPVLAILATLLSGPATVRGGTSSPGFNFADIFAGRLALALPVDGLNPDSLVFSPDWGAYLTASEEAELNAEVAVQVQLGPARQLIREYSDVTTGVYFDRDAGGLLTIAVTKGAPSEVVDTIAKALPQGVSFRVVTVARSISALHALQDQVLALAPTLEVAGSTISAVGVDEMHDVVTALVSDAYGATALGSVAGDAVRVQIGTMTPTVCTNVYNCIPIRGGLEMQNPLHPGDYQCTMGFNARPAASSSTRYVLSAGHCWRSASDSTFVHNGNTFGSATFSPFQRTTGAHYSDSLLIARNSYGTGIPMNSVFIPNDTSTYTITGQVNLINQNTGDFVCNTGVNAPHSRCGYITIDNDVALVRPGGRWGSTTWTLYGQERASFSVSEGDSGGPVYSIHNAYGIVWAAPDPTHSEYSPIDQIINDMSNFGGLDVRLCFDPNCS